MEEADISLVTVAIPTSQIAAACIGHLSLCLSLILLVNLQVYFEDEDKAELYQVFPGSTLLQVLQHPR